jgi:hypothetical protein
MRRHLSESLALDYRLLPGVSLHSPIGGVSCNECTAGSSYAPIVFHDITLAQLTQEVLVMGDNDKLEVRMVLALVDDADTENLSQRGSEAEERLTRQDSLRERRYSPCPER